jgi:hypothetical protein
MKRILHNAINEFFSISWRVLEILFKFHMKDTLEKILGTPDF